MTPDKCSPPQENVIDLTDLELCPKCKAALIQKFMDMVKSVEIDKRWNQKDLDRFNNGRKRKNTEDETE